LNSPRVVAIQALAVYLNVGPPRPVAPFVMSGPNSAEESYMKIRNDCSMFALVGLLCILSGSAIAQGSLEKVAVSLHDNWFVHTSAGLTATGAQISTPGFA